MSSYYPVTQRPAEFDLVKDHSLWKGCVFAGLGRQTKSFTYRDSSGYGNHGQLTGYTGAGNTPPERWSRALGRAVLGFDGTNDYASGAFQYKEFPWTLSARCNLGGVPGSTAQGIFSISHSTLPRYASLLSYGPYMRAQAGGVGGENNAQTTAAVGAGEWHHVLGVFLSATSRTVYLDGKNTVTNTVNVGALGNLNTLSMQWLLTAGGKYWKAATKVADCIAWSRDLSPSEISLVADPVRSIDYDGGLVWPRGRSQVWFGSAGAASSKIWTRLQQSRVIGGGLGA